MMWGALMVTTGVVVAAVERLLNQSTWRRCLTVGVAAAVLVWGVSYLVVMIGSGI
jgi:hypothetical protein